MARPTDRTDCIREETHCESEIREERSTGLSNTYAWHDLRTSPCGTALRLPPPEPGRGAVFLSAGRVAGSLPNVLGRSAPSPGTPLVAYLCESRAHEVGLSCVRSGA
jgi:hypothetical protein